MWPVYIAGAFSVIIFSIIALARWKRGIDDPWAIMGLSLDRVSIVDMLAGALIGTLAMAGIFLVEWSFQLLRVAGVHLSSLFILGLFVWYLPRTFAEEFFCRGLMLNGISMVLRQKNKWLAVAISSIAFGFIHAANPYASPISILGNALGGMVYALAYLKSGRLWLGTGLHFAWNFVQGPILGFPVSGNAGYGLVSQSLQGDFAYSGGDYGPEAGLIGMGFRFVAMALVLLWCRRSKIPSQPALS
jgi:hypothetical protein